jgi:hypothetical protein
MRQPRVFVIAPFRDEFMDAYRFGIRGACEEVKAECIRVDEALHDNTILEEIYRNLREADVIVSDMTGQSPNVFFETGYAVAIQQRVIYVTRDASDIPFDLKHFPHVTYGGSIVKLRDELVKRLQWALRTPKPGNAQKIDFQPSGLHRSANSFWLGHDLMWTLQLASDPATTPRLLWYGLALCVEHADLLSLNVSKMTYARLQGHKKHLHGLRDDINVTQEVRQQVIDALNAAIQGFGSEITRYQGTYIEPIDPEINEMWAELKLTGRGDTLIVRPLPFHGPDDEGSKGDAS